MHWGTFKLSDEPLREPIDRLRRAWETVPANAGRCMHALAVGETVVFDDDDD